MGRAIGWTDSPEDIGDLDGVAHRVRRVWACPPQRHQPVEGLATAWIARVETFTSAASCTARCNCRDEIGSVRHLGDAQPGAKGDPERGLVFYARCRLEQPGRLLDASNRKR